MPDLLTQGTRARGAFARDVRAGLSAEKKSVPCRWMYDEAGSALFEQICGVPEYYIPAAEREILQAHAAEIAASVPHGAELVELGGGGASGTRILIDAFLAARPKLKYTPVDASPTASARRVQALRAAYPALEVAPFIGRCEDAVSRLCGSRRPKLVVWLGSGVGGLTRVEAAQFLRSVRLALGEKDRLLVGIDLRKDAAVVERAYDDSCGVTARFNKNVLARINRELGARFDVEGFRHRATYHDRDGRLEMSLVADDDHRVNIAQLALTVPFAAGEPIHTEVSYKYSRAEIAALAWAAGFRSARQWLDGAGLFSENLLAP